MNAAPGRVSRGALFDSLVVVRYIWSHPSNRGTRLRVLTRASLLHVRGRVFHKPTLVPCGRRSRIEIWPAEGASGLAYANPPEQGELRVWERTLAPGDLFIDVGANVGSYSIWALEAGATVIAIEPDAHAASRLRRNLEVNGFNAEVIEAAVSDRPGSAQVTVGLGVLNHIASTGEAASTREVPTVTLDDVIGERVVAGVKIDVEGAEGLVIAGAARALREKRIKLLQLEWNPSSDDNFGSSRETLAQTLKDAGYELLRPTADGNGLEPVAHEGPGWDLFARPRADGP